MQEYQGKYLLVTTDYKCNNNCIICSVAVSRRLGRTRGFNDILIDLRNGINQGYSHVEFTGGEPTIRKEIISLVSAAKELGYETIAISTNGRVLRYEKQLQALINAGLNRLTISLHGSKASVHNAITRTPGSFDDVMAAIKCTVPRDDIHLNISTVLNRLNMDDIAQTAELLLALKIKNWYILDLIPDGNGVDFYRELSIAPDSLKEILAGIIKYINQFEIVGFFDFPFCLMPKEILNNNRVEIINAAVRHKISKQIGFNAKRIHKENNIIIDKLKSKLKTCRDCLKDQECGGIWTPLIKIYGEDKYESIKE